MRKAFHHLSRLIGWTLIQSEPCGVRPGIPGSDTILMVEQGNSLPDLGTTLQLKLTGPEGSHFVPLAADELLVGRGAQAQVVVSHEEVSRKHLRILKRGGRVYVTDEGSRNGTFIDGLRLESGKPHLWSEGQIIRLGLAPHALVLEKASSHSPSLARKPIQAPEDFRAPEESKDAPDRIASIQPAPIARRLGGLAPASGTQVEVDLAEAVGGISSIQNERLALEGEIKELKREIADRKLERQKVKAELEHLTQAREDLRLQLAKELDEVQESTQKEVERFAQTARTVIQKAKDEARRIKEEALRQTTTAKADHGDQTKTSSGLIDEERGEGPVTVVSDLPSAQSWLNRIRSPSVARKVYFFVAPLIILLGLSFLTRGAYLRWSQDSLGQGDWSSQTGDLEELQGRVKLTQKSLSDPFAKDGQAFLITQLRVKPQVAHKAIKNELDFLEQVQLRQITFSQWTEHRHSMEQMLGSSSAYNKFIGFQSDFLREKR